MAIISYRPELESPAREGALGVAYDSSTGTLMNTLTLEPGVNRGISDAVWAKVRENSAIKALIKIKAIKEIAVTGDADPEEVVEASPDVQEVRGLPVEDALTVIESSVDEAFLEGLRGADPRATVQKKIVARLAALREGRA
jgi:hypothetical protein